MQTKPVVYTANAMEEKETEDFDNDTKNKLISYLNKNLNLIESDWSQCKIYRCTSGYSNPPYIIKCGSNKYILRTKHDEWTLIKNHPNIILNIREQYKLISALNQLTSVPVPKFYIFCDDVTVINKVFYVMQFIEGRIFTHIGPDLPTIPKQDRIKVYKEMVRVAALIHSVDVNTTGIYDIIKHIHPYTLNAQYNEWKNDFNKVYKDKNVSKNVLKFADVINKTFGDYNDTYFGVNTLIHGDFHFENIIWHPVEYKIIAVVDWEACCIGNPLVELIYACAVYSSFETEMMKNLDPPLEYHTGFKYIDTKQLGIPTETEQIMNYLNFARDLGVSPLTLNKMIEWVNNNWKFGLAILRFRFTAAFSSMFNDEEATRINETFGKRQYAMLDSLAVHGLAALNDQPIKLPYKLPSKL